MSVTEKLERKFSVPHLFEFESARGHKISYVVDQAIKDRLLYCALKQGTDYREFQMFDPRYSIDDFFFIGLKLTILSMSNLTTWTILVPSTLISQPQSILAVNLCFWIFPSITPIVY